MALEGQTSQLIRLKSQLQQKYILTGKVQGGITIFFISRFLCDKPFLLRRH
jgi:hypothetical protein